MYFLDADYEVFTQANSSVKSTALDKKRKAVQSKLLKVHEAVYPRLQLLGIDCHSAKQHITSDITPNRFNGTFNSWIFVRYGRTPEEMEQFKAIGIGFPELADIQYGLFEGRDFCIQLFLGSQKGYDRQRLPMTMRRNRAAIEAAVGELRGYGMQWEITGLEPFSIDDAEPSAFCDWLLANNNCEGESFLTLHYDREDPLISEQKLASEVFGKVRRLVPLYNLLTQRKK